MKVLEGTDKAWVVELLYAFNAGVSTSSIFSTATVH
jgi:hypothetical protein